MSYHAAITLAASIGEDWASQHPKGEPRVDWNGMASEDWAAIRAVWPECHTADRKELEHLELAAKFAYIDALDAASIH
jgi:hypothetical protein